MGLFDTVKEKANALAADAERAGKVTAAQARTVVLQNEIRKAERELGRALFAVIDSGQQVPPGLAEAVAHLREAHQALQDKEAEIMALRGGAATPGTPGPVKTPAEAPAPEGAAAAKTQGAAGAPAAAEQSAGEADQTGAAGSSPAAGVDASAPAKRRGPAKAATRDSKKGAAKPAATKASAEKPASEKARPASKPAAGKASARKPSAKKPPANNA
jgi:hypothetical protein